VVMEREEDCLDQEVVGLVLTALSVYFYQYRKRHEGRLQLPEDYPIPVLIGSIRMRLDPSENGISPAPIN